MNPFSDCWLVARGFQTEPGPAGLEGGKKLKQKQQVSPSTDQRKRDKKKSETKQKLRLPGVSVSLCDIKTLELFVGESWGLVVAGARFLQLDDFFLLEAHWAAGTF